MAVLEDLWYGKITPWQMGSKTEEYKTLMAQISESEKKLLRLLPEEGKEVYEKLMDLQSKASVMEQREMFLRSFKLGAKFILEITDGVDNPSVSV